MAYKDRFGATVIKKGRHNNFQVSWDYDDDIADIKQRVAVFLFTPDMKNKINHEHIALTDKEAIVLRDWLNEFIKEKERAKKRKRPPEETFQFEVKKKKDGYSAKCKELDCFAQGDTVAVLKANMIEALQLHLGLPDKKKPRVLSSIEIKGKKEIYRLKAVKKTIKAEELDRMFDAGEDISEHLDISSAARGDRRLKRFKKQASNKGKR